MRREETEAHRGRLARDSRKVVQPVSAELGTQTRRSASQSAPLPARHLGSRVSAALVRASAGPPRLILVAADEEDPEGRSATVPMVETGTPAWRRGLSTACWQLPRQQKEEQDPVLPPSGQTPRRRPGSSSKGFGHGQDAHVNLSSVGASHGPCPSRRPPGRWKRQSV